MERNRKMWDIEVLSFISAVLLIVLFGYTAVAKLLDYEKFVFQMRLSPAPMVAWAAPVLGWFVPLIEIVIVAALCFERWRVAGLHASLFLLLIFEVYIVTMLLSGSKLPCTCGGIVSKMSWTQHLWFNLAFMLVAAAPVVLKKSQTQMNIQRVRKRE